MCVCVSVVCVCVCMCVVEHEIRVKKCSDSCHLKINL